LTDALSLLIAFGVTSLAIEMTPGPNMGYLAVLGMSQGRPAGLSAVLGVALGLCVLGLLVGFGAGSFVLDNRWAYESLRWAGSLYLLWLAYDGWRDAGRPLDIPAAGASFLRHFRRGLITNMLNPAAIFFVAVLPDFVDPTRPQQSQLLLLVAVYVGIATAVHATVVVLASLLQPMFTDPALRRGSSAFFALLLGCIAVWLLL
jgi:threonine/homoserine/homoserine lactone efflux protein